jgi:ribonucleoside-diphosphate reductase alpha chain
MMAAAQPFISGAISKTINLPNEATVDDIMKSYRLSWELGLKANALYRDGCKLSQPLSSKSDAPASDPGRADPAGPGLDAPEVRVLSRDEDADGVEEAREEVAASVASIARAASARPTVESKAAIEAQMKSLNRPMRRRLADTRRSITHKFNVAGHEGYLTVGLYDDGMPGELFITMAKEGSTTGGLMDSLGTAVSVALQYGVPIESLVNKFTHQRFEPAGMTTNRDIPFAKSLVDYIFRWMGMQFIPGYRDANAPKRPSEPEALHAEPARLPSLPSRSEPDEGLTLTARHTAKAAARPAPERIVRVTEVAEAPQPLGVSTLSAAMRDCQGDAPACEVCGAITVRNGSCYRCLNCGHSMGCS